jgi:hypothetical protein
MGFFHKVKPTPSRPPCHSRDPWITPDGVIRRRPIRTRRLRHDQESADAVVMAIFADLQKPKTLRRQRNGWDNLLEYLLTLPPPQDCEPNDQSQRRTD